MSVKIIDGRKLAEKIKDKIVEDIVKLNKANKQCLNHHPNLAIVLVGNKKDSKLYANKKVKTAQLVGVDTHLYNCEADMGQEKLIETIQFLNDDDSIDAIMVQLPLPKDQGYNTDEIIRKINPRKDVDRFHPDIIKPIRETCNNSLLLPPVFGAIIEMLKSIDYDLEDKIVTIVSKNKIFGESLAKCLSCREALALAVRPDDNDFYKRTSEADLLISVVGQPGLISDSMIKEDVVIIDVGISRDMGSVKGDVDFESCKEKASYISPVPGGVGPMTVAMTLKNTLELYKQNKKIPS